MSMKCRVLTVKEEGDLLIVQFEDSPFRAAGSGQPCDLGTIKAKDFEGKVTEVLFNNLVEVKPIKGTLEPEDVECEIDQKRRNILSRMHTAEHIIFKALKSQIKDLELIKINLDEDRSHIFVKTDNLSWDNLLKAEKLANEVVKEGKEIKEFTIKKSDIENYPLLRINEEKILGDDVRVVDIEAYDMSACSGTHCKNTSEVGDLLISKFNSAGKGKFEIIFTLNVIEEMYRLANAARLASGILGVEVDKLPSILKNTQKQVEGYKKLVRHQKLDVNEEMLGDIKLLYNSFEGVGKKELINSADKLMDDKTVLFFQNNAKKPEVMLFVSKDLNLDANEMVSKVVENFGGKGGGKKEFAMCSVEKEPEKVLGFVKGMINS